MIRDDVTWGQLEEEYHVWYDMTGIDDFLGYTLEEIQSNDPDELVNGGQ